MYEHGIKKNMHFNILDLIKKVFLQKKSSNMRDITRDYNARGFGASVFDYGFMLNLTPREYPKYLEKAYFVQMGKKLNLKHPKTLTEKIQWLKLYDNALEKTNLTDKVLVREWVKDKIGEKYLKPIFQICNSFDEINFENLPEKFMVKCNHGCKWQYIVKNKEEYLKHNFLIPYSKRMVDNWMKQSFYGWSDFELQYKDIKPKILVEKLLSETTDKPPKEFEVWCFNSVPKIFTVIDNKSVNKNVYDENYNLLDLKFSFSDDNSNSDIKADKLLKEAVLLSQKLANDFKLVRVDWIVYNNQLYFNEMTFTPHSGFIHFPKECEKWNKKLGEMLNLKGN